MGFKENISSEPQAHDISTQTKSTENKIFMDKHSQYESNSSWNELNFSLQASNKPNTKNKNVGTKEKDFKKPNHVDQRSLQALEKIVKALTKIKPKKPPNKKKKKKKKK